ncbi:protein PSK SIMULATOR 1-like [Andrographis paniculata]|uniref:protein PSK SIMULATOR 1-like n=1 Tax=Andrographis paniculata TaxID=175694 RepID=UPI0021E73D47|nr:protein PSK SIMULATOR 1-like [Andrographis paniculata]XP_051114359.1 protein PSK SIMULATOR 1-like [Andrographis paniculata]XP_051114360.1 protein PSK SIMULATOR 1-like [Andrographis paniculata]
MVGEAVTEKWFGNIWKSSLRSMPWEIERPVLGILAFEVSRLMSKMVSLWQCLAYGQMVRLREEISNSIGIHRLVSEDDNYLMDLALAEIIENVKSVVKSVVILGKKCSDSRYHNLELVFDNVDEIDPKWCGWKYRPKKMEKKVKKMEGFVATTEQLFQEIEVLAELEQSFRRIRGGGSADSSPVKILEFQRKVLRQRQEVKNLRDMSPWGRSFDYIVQLLLKSIFTIIDRVKSGFGIEQIGNASGGNDYEQINGECLVRSNSMRASIYPSEVKSFRFSVPLGRSLSNLGLGVGKHKSKRIKSHLQPRSFSPVVVESNTSKARKVSSFMNSKRSIIDASPSTLGFSALALHFANIIILIEKLAQSPHLISTDAREDLYNMLPATIKSSLRAKLKTFSRTPASSAHDAALAADWSLAIGNILEWLSPLAHNMVKWQSERNFERQRLVFRSNVLLVQTLFFANQAETEAAIVELLMGLNYLSKFGRGTDWTPLKDPLSSAR